MFPLFPQLENLSQLMNASEMRQRVISHNLANVNTPGYQRLDVEFEEALAAHVKAGRSASSSVPAPHIVEQQGLTARNDGNNVDIDKEVIELNRNAMLYQTYSQILASRFDMLRRAAHRG